MKTKILTLLLALFGVAGCGLSPALHHSDPQPAANPLVVSGPAPGGDASTGGDPAAPACTLPLPKAGLCVGFKWESEPRTDEELAAAVTLTDANGRPADAPAELGVQLWMPSMGHGSSPVLVERQDLGVYRASRINFIMPGQWEVRVQLKHGREVDEQVAFGLKL